MTENLQVNVFAKKEGERKKQREKEREGEREGGREREGDIFI